MKTFFCLMVLLIAVPIARAAETPRLEFNAGDRIVFLGNDFFDREQAQAYIETQLISRFPEKQLTFRNLGYSGDTVWAQARNLCAGWDNFGPADQGFERLAKLINQINPTVVFLGYGMNESFDGPAGIEPFSNGLRRMIDMLTQQGEFNSNTKSTRQVRIVLISPIRHEDLGRPLPDPTAHNANIRLYADAMRNVAKERGSAFIDLFAAPGLATAQSTDEKLTSDGIHLTPYGYWRAAAAIEAGLGHTPRSWHVEIDAKSDNPATIGTEITNLKRSTTGVTFTSRDATLPTPPPVKSAPASILNGRTVLPGQERTLKVTGLEPGRYALKSEGQTLCIATADEWARGVQLLTGPADDQAEALRQLVIAKDFDFFNYWRPENDTYIFGYRKHEQGRNAVEVPHFLELVADKEAQIAALAIPAAHAYELIRQGEK